MAPGEADTDFNEYVPPNPKVAQCFKSPLTVIAGPESGREING
jgi:hypothetical protein